MTPLIKTNHVPIFLIATLLLLVVVGLLISFTPQVYAAEPLVQCGTEASGRDCEICDIFSLLQRVLNFLMDVIAPAIATVLFMYAGFTLIVNSGNAGGIEKGKTIFRTTVIGVVIIYGAWVATNFLLITLAANNGAVASWSKIDCTNPAGGGRSDGGDTPQTSSSTKPIGPGQYTEQDAQAVLAQNGIGKLRTCGANESKGCVSLNGIQKTTLEEMLKLKSDCDVAGCQLYVTGGTEGGHADGTYSHGNGYKIDLRSKNQADGGPNSLTNYITTSSDFIKIGDRSSGPVYARKDNPKVSYYLEAQGTANEHWDIQVIP